MAEIIGESQAAEWQALLELGKVRFQKCAECGRHRHPARWICPECLSERWDWVAVGGGATVDYIVRYAARFDPRGPDAPYNVAIIQLDEGPRLTTNLLDGGPPDHAVGTRVRLEIGNAADGAAILLARADGGCGG